MGATIGELDQRQMERLRAEIAEAMASSFAYPPFFSYAAGREVVRPIDRAKRDELEQFVRSANVSPLDRTDASSPEVRRFLERLMSRYLDVNPALQRPWSARRAAALRARVPRVAAEVHRALLADLAGGAAGFGARRQQRSWLGAGGRRTADGTERNTQVLEAILTRGESGPLPPPAAPPSRPEPHGAPAAAPAYAADGRGGAMGWLANPTDATIPVPAHPLNGGDALASPFASFATGAQSAIFGDAASIADRPTGPLAAPPAAPAPASQPAGVRGLSGDLYQLYGDYLRDMHPELAAAPTPAPPAPPAVQQRRQPQPTPSSAPSSGYAAPAAASADAQIFFQLRYQLESFVRRAARSYGVRGRTDEPTSMLDALRRSGFVDESDLRLAESILAITDKVISSGVASMDDFRQALMLYLLYHRSHLGG